MSKQDFAYHLTNYLSIFLPGQKGLRPHSILSYRDAFVLFLKFCQQYKSIKIERLSFRHMSRKLVEEFLLWLECDNGCGASTRNQRLTAIRSFFRYVQTEAPEHLLLCQSIVSIERKKHAKPVVNYLTHDGIKAILAQPNTETQSGRRDLALLETFYDSAARVQELCDLIISDVRLDAPATLRLTGKHGKVRYVPLTSPVVSLLRQYLHENNLISQATQSIPLFINRSAQPLTRSGVRYILKKYVDQARLVAPANIPEKVTPHCMRHSKAMHLLQSGSNLIYIRDFLGHEDIETTQIYAKADPEMKRKALTSSLNDDLPAKMPSWKNNPDLLSRLMAMGKS
jgi:site-specific recombinase XerD